LAGGESTIKMAEVSDCVDVVLRMSSDEGVRGRAAAIAAEKKSFDLCDESEGLGVGKILSDPEYLKFFGYGPAAEKQKKEDDEAKKAPAPAEEKPAEEKPAAVEEKPVEAAVPTTNGTATEAPVAEVAAAKPVEVATEKANIVVPVTQEVAPEVATTIA